MPYKIVEAKASVAVVGAHNYFVLVDPNGNRMDEIHGFVQNSNGTYNSGKRLLR
jgi:hypothetical protein